MLVCCSQNHPQRPARLPRLGMHREDAALAAQLCSRVSCVTAVRSYTGHKLGAGTAISSPARLLNKRRYLGCNGVWLRGGRDTF